MGFGELQSEMSNRDPRSSFVGEPLDDLSDGVRRAPIGDIRPGPMLIVRDGVSMARMRRPFAPYLSLSVYPE